MWLLRGRYGEEAREEQSKLLKYGQTYIVGRKIPADIVVESKFVSRTACRIQVGTLDPAQRTDIDARPTVTITFEHSKSRPSFTIHRPDPDNPDTTLDTSVQAQQPTQLHHGCDFVLTTTISLRLEWVPYAVCFSGKIKSAAIEPLAERAHSLGITLSPAKTKWHPGFTHLCVNQIKPTETALSALIQAKPIVTLAFLGEMLRIGDLPRHDPQSLETNFHEPELAPYLPEARAEDFPGTEDVEKCMLPSQVRPSLFSGTVCVLLVLPEDQTEAQIYENILTLGGALVLPHNPLQEGLATQADFTRLLMPYRNRAISYRSNSNAVGMREAPDDGLVVFASISYADEPWHKACTAACANLRIPMPEGFHGITYSICRAEARSALNVIPSAAGVEADGAAGPSAAPPASTEGAAPAPAHQALQDQHAEVPSPSAAPGADDTRVEPTTSTGAATDAQDAPAVARTAPPQTALAPSRATAPAGSPSADAEPSATPAARRPLRRRTQRTNVIDDLYGDGGAPTEGIGGLGRNAAAVVAAATPAPEAAVAAPQPPYADADSADGPRSSRVQQDEAVGAAVVPPTPSRRAGRLTRRTGAGGTRSRRSEIFDDLLGIGGSASVDPDVGDGDGDDLTSQGVVPKSRRFRMELDEEDRRESQSLGHSAAGSARGTPAPAPADAMDEDDETSGSRRRTRLAPGRSSLDAVPEGRVADGDVSGRKRRADTQDVDGDVDMADANGDDAAQGGAAARKRVRSSGRHNGDEEGAASPPPSAPPSTANQVIRRSPGAGNDGRNGVQQGGQPDTEPEFLRALNTQKSRRKKMDEFDEEFNQLNITKPAALQRGKRGQRQTQQPSSGGGGGGAGNHGQQQDRFIVDEDFEAFKRLAEEELRIDVRGNFVQVDFVPLVVKKPHSMQQQQRSSASSAEREGGVPNFKKFKPKKAAASSHSQQTQSGSSNRGGTASSASGSTRRQPVQLQLTEANDYGIGEAYWKGRKVSGGGVSAGDKATLAESANRIDVDGEEMDLIPPPPKGGRVRGTNINLVLSDDSEADQGGGGASTRGTVGGRGGGTRKASGGTVAHHRQRRRGVAEEDATSNNDDDDDDEDETGPLRANLDLTGLDSDEDGEPSFLPPTLPFSSSRARRGGGVAATTTATRSGVGGSGGSNRGETTPSQPSSATIRNPTSRSRESSIIPSKRSAPTSSSSTAAVVAGVGSSSDEEQPTRLSPRKRKKRGLAHEVVVLSSEAEEGEGGGEGDGNFAGFGASTAARRRGAVRAATSGGATQSGGGGGGRTRRSRRM